MGNWKEKQDVIKATREKEKICRETLGKFFFDLAKLIFTTMVLVGAVSLIMEETKIEYWMLLISGVLTTVIFARIGYSILKR